MNLNAEEILAQHSQIAVLTLDVFDTVVTRAVAQPTHVFAHMEEHLVSMHGRVWKGFALRRVRAEHRARALKAISHPAHDVTLREILQNLASDAAHVLSREEVAMLDELEHSTEIQLARPVVLGCTLAELARTRGLDVYFVSDNYMSSAHIVNMLQAVGLQWVQPGQVFVSSEHGAMKSGVLSRSLRVEGPTLWETVARIIQTKQDSGAIAPISANVNGRCLHVGDNVLADGFIPQQYGFRTHLDLSMLSSHRVMENTTPAVLPLSRIEAWQRDKSANGIVDVAASIGSGLVAMVIAAQILDIQRVMQHRKITGVHFVARDGYLAHQVWSSLQSSGSQLPPASYMAFSRSVAWRARLTEVNESTIARFIGDDEELTVERLERRVGCALMSDHARTEALSAGVARTVLVKNADAIVAASVQLRMRMVQHLRSCGVLEPGHHLVVDLGWTGSSLADLADIVREETNGASVVEGRLTGLYWDASANRPRIALNGFAMDEFHSVDDNLRLLGMLKMLEVLMTAPHGSVIGYGDASTGFAPVYADSPVERIAYDTVIANIARAAASSARDLVMGTHPSGVVAADITGASVWAAMMQVGHTPRLEEVECLAPLRQISAIDHEGEGLPLVMDIPAWAGKYADPTRITDTLIHGHWVQGTLCQWRQEERYGEWVSNIQRVLPFVNQQWVHSSSSETENNR